MEMPFIGEPIGVCLHSLLLSSQKLCILKYCFLPLAKGKEACLTRRVEYTVVAHMSSIVS